MTSKLERFRQHKDEYFASGEHSPLPGELIDIFERLDYFDENPALAFELQLDRSAERAGDRIALDTSDGQIVDFAIAGKVSFEVEGRTVELTVLRDLDRGRFFLPFRDATSGEETYVDGRYLDPQERPDGRMIVDFNYAYNPYCAYDEGWSCPLPPERNYLDVPINAGERRFRRD